MRSMKCSPPVFETIITLCVSDPWASLTSLSFTPNCHRQHLLQLSPTLTRLLPPTTVIPHCSAAISVLHPSFKVGDSQAAPSFLSASSWHKNDTAVVITSQRGRWLTNPQRCPYLELTTEGLSKFHQGPITTPKCELLLLPLV